MIRLLLSLCDDALMLMLLPFHSAIVFVDTMTYEQAQGHKGIVGPSLGLRNVLAIEAECGQKSEPRGLSGYSGYYRLLYQTQANRFNIDRI